MMVVDVTFECEAGVRKFSVFCVCVLEIHGTTLD